jgi:hypothetical protein
MSYGLPAEAIEHVGTMAQLPPHLAKLQQRRLVGDMTPLGFLDDGVSAQQCAL